MNSKFQLGKKVMTYSVASRVAEDEAFAQFVTMCMARHASGDWGDLDDEDKATNDHALRPGRAVRILSAYKQGKVKIWIITEWDRSVTTVLFPDEY